MRNRCTLSMFGIILLSAPAFAANLTGKTLTGAPAPVTLQFSVPYDFSNVHHELDHAVIRCVAQLGPMSPPIASGQVTVMLKGQPKSGTAIIAVNPVFGQKLSDARHYSCGMQVSNGKMTLTPQLGAGPAWAKTQPGSTLMVSGKIQ